MQLIELLMFCMSSAGITIIIVASDLMLPVRNFLSRSLWLERLVNCTMCTGVWVGAFLSLYFDINPIIAASISSVVSWSVYNIVDAANSIAIHLDGANEKEE